MRRWNLAVFVTLVLAFSNDPSSANPYLAKPGESPVPVRVADAVENARQAGTNVRRKPADIYDNSFAENLDKSGFLKELWGGEVPGKKW